MGVVPVKGSLTVVDTGEFAPFMFNPANIRQAKGINYAEQIVPGVSDPVIQYAAGGARTISLELYLDGDRGRNRPRRQNARRTDKGDSLDIADEIRFYESLLYPMKRDGVLFTDVHPSVVLFSFGVLYQRVPCVVATADSEVTFWTPDLRPMKATVRIELKEKRERGRERDDIYTSGEYTWRF